MKKLAILVTTVSALALSHNALAVGNPASEFCAKKGGKSFTKKDKKGNEVGFCKLKNGKTVDEWKYFRANSKK